MHGPRLASEALTRDLEGSRTLNAYSTRELLTRLEASPQLLSQSDDDDIDTTVRTLNAITKRPRMGSPPARPASRTCRATRKADRSASRATTFVRA
jgi:hypothetical protein